MKSLYRELRNEEGDIERIETGLCGAELLETPKLNKGTAFTLREAGQPLLPDFSDVIANSRIIAKAVVKQAMADGVAQIDNSAGLDLDIREISWEPVYYPYE